MDIGESIKQKRKIAKLTQKELAEQINKSERMLQKYENGEVTPSLDVLKELSNALNVPIDSFFENVFQKWDIIYDSEKLAKEVKAIESFESLLKQYGYNFRMFSYGEEDITNEDPIYEIYLTPKESIELTKGQYEELMKELREFVDFKLHRLKKAKR